MTVSAGSTLGFAASQISRIYVLALDNAGTVELAVYHPLSGTTHLPVDETLFQTSTAEGGAGGADSAQVVYSTTARTNVSACVLGFIDIQTGGTAGNWSNSPIHVQVLTAATPRSGQVIQRLLSSSTALVTGATTMPFDDTIPQSGEGVQMLTQAITPRHAADLLFISHVGMYSPSASGNMGVALFQDSTANALAAVACTVNGANEVFTIPLIYQMQAGTTSSTTFKIRAGHASGSIAMNGQGGAATRLYGGVAYSGLAITAIFI